MLAVSAFLPLLPDPVCQKALRALEEYIEGATDLATYLSAYTQFDLTRRSRFPKFTTPDDDAWLALYCAVHRRWQQEHDDHFAQDRWRICHRLTSSAAATIGPDEVTVQGSLVRDIFGNPFTHTTIQPVWLAWNGGLVTKLAQAIYDDLAFDVMPILADALEDSGCDNAAILNHCRRECDHVRGCWAVDLLLAKT